MSSRYLRILKKAAKKKEVEVAPVEKKPAKAVRKPRAKTASKKVVKSE